MTIVRIIRGAGVAPGGGSSALALACAALSSGQSATFASGAQSEFSEDDVAWQTAFYHDDLHGLLHLMAKPQNAASAWGHQIYDIAAGTWGNLSDGMWNNDGHIYGNTAIDFDTGDIYQSRNNAGTGTPDFGRRARWWKYSEQDWDSVAPVSQDIYSGAMNATPNGLAWHPNLFGTGDGGLIWGDQVSFLYWRKSNDAVSRRAIGTDEYGARESGAVYWPAQDAVLIGGSRVPDISNLAMITPNPTPGGDPVLTDLSAPPMSVRGGSHSSSGVFGSIHVHPGNPNKVLILESAGSDAYESTDGENWTQIGDHPFTLEPRVVCSLRGNLGCMLAVGAVSTTPRLWRPPT
jgi:hypothetical protein